jgi:hypothetical protein
MRLVLADIDEKSLRDAANALPRTDDCVQVVSDVSIEEDMARLASSLSSASARYICCSITPA